MQLHGKPVKMTNVQWAEIGMKGIVQEALVYGEVHRWVHLRAGSCWAGLRLGRPLARGATLSRVGEWRAGIRRVRV